jgi:hypothetical protein
VKRKPSERTLFERWAEKEGYATVVEIAQVRTPEGYASRDLDFLWLGWMGRAVQPAGDA